MNLSSAAQAGLKENGVFFERCFASTFPRLGNIPVERIVEDIRAIGPSSTLLTTDLGISGYPEPVVGMRDFVGSLLKLGVTKEELNVMVTEVPGSLLET